MLERVLASVIARRYAIAVVSGIAGLTLALLVVTELLSMRFAAQLRDGLEARAQHGAQELAAVAALAAERDDAKLFNHALEAHVTSPDLQTIAIDANGKMLVSHGEVAAVRWVFDAAPNLVVRRPGYVASWAAGPASTRIAVVLSTVALDDLDALQARVSYLLLAIGGVAAVGFVLVRRWRSAPRVRQVAVRADPASAELDALAQVLLEHASQGFVIVELATQRVRAHAAIVERWLGAPAPDATLASYLGGAELGDLAQLPAQIARDDRTLSVRAAPIDGERLLIILNDITEELALAAAAREAREEREVAALAELITTNRAEFDEFFAEVARLLALLEVPADADVELGTIRALKDNCAYYGLDGYVEICMKIEASLRETSAAMTDAQRVAVSDGWGRISSRLMRISGS